MAISAEVIVATVAAFVAGGVFGMYCRPRRLVIPGATGDEAAPVRERSASFVSLAGALGAAVLVLDENDRLVFFNEASRRLLGLGDDSLAKDSAVAVRSADFIERLRKFRHGEVAGGVSPIAVRRGGVGGEFLFESTLAPLPLSAGFGDNALVVVMVDVTRLRRLEGMRREFVSNVSHDLRTPVTIVKGYSAMLVEDYAVMTDEDRVRFLGKIQRNVARLHLLLEDLLVLSSLEDGVSWFNLEPGVLHGVIRDVTDMFSDRMQAAKIEVVLALDADDAHVAVDSPKMARVIQNLLENVLRYGAGVATRVRISTTPGSDGLVLRIEDDGPGVVSSEYDKVFERFYRAEKSRSAAGGGSGIGLSIVKHIVLAHQGAVRAEPVRPKGFGVVITLPFLPPGAE